MLPGVAVPSIIVVLPLFIGMDVLGVPVGAHADRVNARAINEKIITFFILIFPLNVGIATKYKEFPIS